MIEKEFDCLSNIRMKKMNRQIIANLCITSISSKFDQLKLFVQGKVYIFIVTKNQIELDLGGHSEPYHFARNTNGIRVLIYI